MVRRCRTVNPEEGREVVALIGRPVVGHHALDRHAMSGKEGERAPEEGDGVVLALIGRQFGIGEPGGVIDGDMERLPAGAALTALTSVIAGDAMADAVDAAELLAVDVDELARPFALVALVF